MDRHDIIIIGAGISGLSLAHYCAKEGLNTLVIEKTERVGGTLYSHRFKDIGFWLEMGAHTCYNSYQNLIEIIEECGIINSLFRRENLPFKMLVNSHIKSIPSQLNFLELLLSIPNIFSQKKEGQNVRSYYSKILGNKNFERVLSPAFNAVISQDANDFPVDMLFKKRNRRKDIMKKFTFLDGIQTITDSILSHGTIKTVTGKEVISVNTVNNLFQVITKDCTYESNFLAIATPAAVAANLLKKDFPDISNNLQQIKVKSVESVGIVVKKDFVTTIPKIAGIIPLSDSFYSIVSRDTVKHDMYRGFTFHFKPNILDSNYKLKRIVEVLGIKTPQIEYVVEKENFVPSLRVRHVELINKIDSDISKTRLFLTGNYFNGMAIEDCVTRSFKEFLRLKQFITSHGG